MEEPRIRVGLAKVKNEMIFHANTDVMLAVGDARERQATIPMKQPMRVAWNGTQYVFETGGNILLLSDYPRFFGNDSAQTIFTVTSLDDVRSWNTNLNDNQFRDTLELRHNGEGTTWLVNELPMEYYLYGIDETSNSAPQEYHKALLTAARTYALYMWEHKTKYKGEHIDVRATTADQVYHGYGAEIRRPNVVKAIDATRGVTVQYEGQTIVATYSARTDGRTRSWKEVWGKVVPYAVSVPVPCEKGQTKWGHSVGLSAGGAVCMAKEGKTFDQILTYFYKGVELVDRW
jgi:peptidoglycan hydrolase-like amidase